MSLPHPMLQLGRKIENGNLARKTRSWLTMSAEIPTWTCQPHQKLQSLQQGRNARRTVLQPPPNQAKNHLPRRQRSPSRWHHPLSHERRLLLANRHHHQCQSRARHVFAAGRRRFPATRRSRHVTSAEEDCGHASMKSMATRNARRTVASIASSESGNAQKKGHHARTVCDWTTIANMPTILESSRICR